jgi:uncharacterized protein (TIGR03435 family)
MVRQIPSLVLLALVCGVACSQPSDFTLTFEVASVKASPPRPVNGPMRVGCTGGPGTNDPGRWTCQNMTVLNLISNAYNLRRYQQPTDSFDADRWEVAATMAAGTTREQFREMLKNLLKERFKLAVHFEKKEVPGYELVAAKGGVKMKEAQPPKNNPDGDRAPGRGGPLQRDKEGFPILTPGQDGMAIMNGKARWVSPQCTMDRVVNMMINQLNAPVVDATGLSGKYDVNMFWQAGGFSDGILRGAPAGGEAGASEPEGPTIFTALQEQLGLKLQSKKASIEALVVDHLEKVPTEN